MINRTLPRRFYADPDFYRAELERFYINRWICAGRADQIPNAGDYFTRALAHNRVILTRDRARQRAPPAGRMGAHPPALLRVPPPRRETVRAVRRSLRRAHSVSLP